AAESSTPALTVAPSMLGTAPLGTSAPRATAAPSAARPAIPAPSAPASVLAPAEAKATAASVNAPDIVLTGTLAVGGPVGASVLVDGAPRGLTPKYIPLALGTHRVEVVSSDGARLGSTVVTLKPEHTASNPLRWSPAPQ